MHAPVHNFVAHGLVCTVGHLIIDNGIRSHLDTSVIACPLLRLGKQLSAYPAVTVILVNVPALDVTHWL